jgi:hypothetical protein
MGKRNIFVGLDVHRDTIDRCSFRPCQHSANATLPERNGRGTKERTGGELEQQRPTASSCVGKLIDPVSLDRVSPKCHAV